MATSRRSLKLAVDTVAFALAGTLAYAIRFEGDIPAPYLQQLAWVVPCVAAVRIAAWQWLGVSRRAWRHFGLRDAIALGRAAGLVSVVLLAFRLVAPSFAPSLGIPLGVIALEGLLVVAGSFFARAVVRRMDEDGGRQPIPVTDTRPRALLVGAGRTGRMAVTELQRSRDPDAPMIVGFLDDDPQLHGQSIGGVAILGSTRDVAEIATQVGANLLILAMPSATGEQRRRVYEACQSTHLEVRTVPAYHDLVSGRLGVSATRPLRIEDLLGREVVRFEEQTWAEIHSIFAGKRILVTGAGGSIGSEICRQLAALDPALVILVDNTENNLFDIEMQMRDRIGTAAVGHLADVRNEAEMERVFSAHRPDAVFHAAAFKHVPMMERHPAAATLNNVMGTRVVAEMAERFGCERFLLISTDKAVTPSSIMGATKRAAELAVASHALRQSPESNESQTAFCTVRFGNVLGSNGSVLHTFARQIDAGGPVTVTHPEVSRFFMTIPEAVRLVIASSALAEGGDVYVLDMGEPLRIVDLARNMIRLHRKPRPGSAEVEIAFTGLRPGEKLHERLWRDDEVVCASGVPGILAAAAPCADVRELERGLRRLEQAAEAMDDAAVKAELRAFTGYCPPTRHRAAANEPSLNVP